MASITIDGRTYTIGEEEVPGLVNTVVEARVEGGKIMYMDSVGDDGLGVVEFIGPHSSICITGRPESFDGMGLKRS